MDSPQSYLYMIATNLVRDHWRKTERERRAIRSVTAGAAADPVAYPAQDVDVRNLIASLPPRLRDPFLLHYYGGFAIREVATLLRPPGGHHQGRPVRGARQAEDGAGGTRWLTAATTSTPG